jgi:hypothetical protein
VLKKQEKIMPQVKTLAADFAEQTALVRATGLEPAHRLTLEPKSSASANSATPARVYFNK